MKVTLVPTEHVDGVWPLVERHMAAAAEYTFGRYNLDDIRESVTQYDHTLWLATDDDLAVVGGLVTCIRDYPRKRFLNLVFIGGERGLEWKDEMLSTMQCWAKDNHCDGIESIGRVGWSQIFKQDGYTLRGYSYELPLGGEMEA